MDLVSLVSTYRAHNISHVLGKTTDAINKLIRPWAGRYARLTKEKRTKGLRDNAELIKKTEKATKQMKKTVGRLRKKGYDMVGSTKGDKGHTREWLAAIKAADAMG